MQLPWRDTGRADRLKALADDAGSDARNLSRISLSGTRMMANVSLSPRPSPRGEREIYRPALIPSPHRGEGYGEGETSAGKLFRSPKSYLAPALLGVHEVFGADLPGNPAFAGAVTDALDPLLAQGARKDGRGEP